MFLYNTHTEGDVTVTQLLLPPAACLVSSDYLSLPQSPESLGNTGTLQMDRG